MKIINDLHLANCEFRKFHDLCDSLWRIPKMAKTDEFRDFRDQARTFPAIGTTEVHYDELLTSAMSAISVGNIEPDLLRRNITKAALASNLEYVVNLSRVIAKFVEVLQDKKAPELRDTFDRYEYTDSHMRHLSDYLVTMSPTYGWINHVEFSSVMANFKRHTQANGDLWSVIRPNHTDDTNSEKEMSAEDSVKVVVALSKRSALSMKHTADIIRDFDGRVSTLRTRLIMNETERKSIPANSFNLERFHQKSLNVMLDWFIDTFNVIHECTKYIIKTVKELIRIDEATNITLKNVKIYSTRFQLNGTELRRQIGNLIGLCGSLFLTHVIYFSQFNLAVQQVSPIMIRKDKPSKDKPSKDKPSLNDNISDFHDSDQILLKMISSVQQSRTGMLNILGVHNG